MKIEIRSDSELTVSGYVNAVERRSRVLPKEKGEGAPGDFTELIKAGTFAESLRRIPSVELKFNHRRVIGGTGKNLILNEDSIGLHAEATITDEETVKAARAGLLKGWSFGMKNAHGEYVRSGAVYERDVDKLDLLEVSLLTNRPAYPATSVELRDGESIETRTSDDLPEITAGDMERINQFTRSSMKPEDVYVFPVVLCDNEIDRDGERFSVSSLMKLSELFVGKTGIFDHDPKAGNQTARVFFCEAVTVPDKLTSYGEPYTELRAKAYMIRTAANADLIKEIEGGIKKEVSISCSVGKRICSVCGSDRDEKHCEHIKGRSYDGTICCTILDEPTDAYEWSFVAVPAQPRAGVTRDLGNEEQSKLAAIKREIEIFKLKGKMYNEDEP